MGEDHGSRGVGGVLEGGWRLRVAVVEGVTYLLCVF